MSDQSYPWSGGEIKGYFYWQGNFVGSSPATQYFADYVSAPQTGYQGSSNIVQASGTFTYSGSSIPNNPVFNAIFLFTGYSNASRALDNLTNYTTQTNMYTDAKTYFSNNGVTDFLLGLCLGGGYSATGSWNTGTDGAIYSIYEAVTQAGVAFSYTETGTGQTLSGVGTGKLDNSYNCLVFDIETWTGPNGSTADDFINLFNYIKHNSNSMFNYEGDWLIKIVVTIAHSCSNYNGTGQNVCGTLYKSDSYDYISPQMYTQNCGTTNEYCANYNILWQTGYTSPWLFTSLIQSNPNYVQYGLNFILPAINFANLYQGGGSNDGNPPNLYFYQSTGNDTNPVVESASGSVTLPYDCDEGVVGFFNSLFGLNETHLGGYAQWVNGTITDNFTMMPAPRDSKIPKIVRKR